MMDIIFFISIGVVGIISAVAGLLPQKKLSKKLKMLFFIVTIACLAYQFNYGLKEKRVSDYKSYKSEMYQNDILTRQGELSDNMKELKEKGKKGILAEADYSQYICNYLESIDLSLKSFNWKHSRNRIIDYYEEIAKIPDYFTFQEWKESENFIYKYMIGEINNNFSARGIYNSGIRIKALESFKIERDRLIAAKEREFNKINKIGPESP